MLTLLLACAAATADFSPPRPHQAEPDSAARASLTLALQAFSTAFQAADAEALDTLLAQDYVHTNGGSGSVLDRSRWLEYIRSRRADLQSGRLRVERYETGGTAIRWFPNMAVVTSRVSSAGTLDGAPFAHRLQVTQVWIRKGDRWHRAAFHDSPVPASAQSAFSGTYCGRHLEGLQLSRRR
jgi:ketosteroid isomerase-like protein